MRKRTRLYVFILTLAFLLAFTPYNAFASQSSTNIDIKVNAGFNNMARIGSIVPFRITLTNKGAEVSGEVQITVPVSVTEKTVYAIPFYLPSKSEKDLVMHIPVNLANKKVEVTLVKGKKTIKKFDYIFYKLITPQTPVIGVMCDNPDAFRKLDSIKIMQNMNLYAAIYNSLKTPESTISQRAEINKALELSGKQAEIIPVDEALIPEDIKAMSNFDILIVSDYDTSLLSEKQTDVIDTWIKNGNLLFLGTGSSWKKVYRGLKDELKPYKISGTIDIPFPKETLCLSDKITDLGTLTIASGHAGKGETVFAEDGNSLGIVYKYSRGAISALTFDPSQSAVTDRTNVQLFWKYLISKAGYIAVNGQSQQVRYSYNDVISSMDFQGIISNIPENQSPPLILLFALTVIYIFVIGPVIYLVLKRKDRRDLSWVAIPAATIVFLMIFYIAGYKTRYSEAVMNKVSVINLNLVKKAAEISTWIGAYNNESGRMKIEYDKNVNLNLNDRYTNDLSRYGQEDFKNAAVTKKVTFSEPMALELYDVHLWQPEYMTAKEIKPIEAFSIDSVYIDNGKLNAVIRNKTDFNLRKSFIVIGNKFYNMGDIDAGQEKKIVINMNISNRKKSFNNFLDSYFGKRNNNPSLQGNLRNIVENILRNELTNKQGNMNIMSAMFFALNYDDPDYKIVLNNKAPKTYNSNVIFSNVTLNSEKGKYTEIPSEIIKMNMDEAKNAYMDDPLIGAMKIFADGEIYLRYALPDNIKVKNIRINYSTFLKSDTDIVEKTATYYIFNYTNSKWEKIQQNFTFNYENNHSDYIKNMELKLKLYADIDDDSYFEELLEAPRLVISGTMK